MSCAECVETSDIFYLLVSLHQPGAPLLQHQTSHYSQVSQSLHSPFAPSFSIFRII
jgi:hypothetical protein